MISSLEPQESPPAATPPQPATQNEAPAPRWTALFALVSVGLINFALPESLSVGPNWLLALLVTLLTIPTVVTHRTGKHDWNQGLGYAVTGLETLALVGSVGLLVAGLPSHKQKPLELLNAGALLWLSNVLVFALWYWRLDAGGPHFRENRVGHRCGDFLFPQMTLDENDPNFDAHWSPQFIDYLFLAFNSSTALSPTDSPILSRPAKLLMMLQSLIAVIILVVLVGRAVNGL